METVSFEAAAVSLGKGNIGVLPTDTLYGLVASALDRKVVERVYRVRGRDEGKPCIVLIADVSDLDRFSCHSERVFESRNPGEKRRSPDYAWDDKYESAGRGWLSKFWPGKVSVILPCPDERFAYLHRGTGTIAFRVPDKPELREFLTAVGPLVAPSANRQGELPAKTIAEARAYFGDAIDFYVDGGTLGSEPSTVVKFDGEKLVIIREGAVKILNHES